HRVDTVVGDEGGDTQLHTRTPIGRHRQLQPRLNPEYSRARLPSVSFKIRPRYLDETLIMNEHAFTPAAGRFAPTRFYDPVGALTRARLWRALAAMYVAPRPGDLIADVGCGTGSLAVLLSRVE